MPLRVAILTDGDMSQRIESTQLDAKPRLCARSRDHPSSDRGGPRLSGCAQSYAHLREVREVRPPIRIRIRPPIRIRMSYTNL